MTTRTWNGRRRRRPLLVGLAVCAWCAAAPVRAQDPFADALHAYLPGTNGGFGADLLPEVVLGPPRGGGQTQGSFDVVALGIGGSIVLRFDLPVICDGPGPDLTVFENAFHSGSPSGPLFVEYGYVAVSQDGVSFVTFPHDPLTRSGLAGQRPVLSHPNNGIDPLDPAVSGGDPFDLAAVGLPWAAYVRITDVAGAVPDPGDLPQFTIAPNAGFDLDAVAALHACDPATLHTPTFTPTVPAPTPTATPSPSPSPTPPATASASPSATPSRSPSATPTPLATASPTPTRSSTATPTGVTPTAPASTPTATLPAPTLTASVEPATPTAVATHTASPHTPTPSPTPPPTPTASPTAPPTATVLVPTATDTATATATSTHSATTTPTAAPPTPSASATASATPAETPTAEATRTPTAAASATPSAAPTDSPTAPATLTATVVPAPIPGDLDGDGSITAADAAWLIVELFDGDGDAAGDAAGGAIASGREADASADGRLTAADLVGIARSVPAAAAAPARQPDHSRSSHPVPLPHGRGGA